MLIDTLLKLYTRDLNKLKTEILGFKNESALWQINHQISNSAGNLCLHIVGNLNTYIGAHIGNTGYIRQRDLEFSLKDVPRRELIVQIDELLETLSETLSTIREDDLKKQYPLNVFGFDMSTEYFLVHLTTHLSYHLGQINYHRRLLDE